jgi:hypothetical protein
MTSAAFLLRNLSKWRRKSEEIDLRFRIGAVIAYSIKKCTACVQIQAQIYALGCLYNR